MQFLVLVQEHPGIVRVHRIKHKKRQIEAWICIVQRIHLGPMVGHVVETPPMQLLLVGWDVVKIGHRHGSTPVLHDGFADRDGHQRHIGRGCRYRQPGQHALLRDRGWTKH